VVRATAARASEAAYRCFEGSPQGQSKRAGAATRGDFVIAIDGRKFKSAVDFSLVLGY